MECRDFDKSRAVEKFRTYLRIRSDHPKPDYDSIVKFLDEYAKELDLEVKHVTVGVEREVVIVVMTLPGKDPTLSSIMLNSHTDVVPAYPERWKCDPFSGFRDENGNIYGRGSQDMKSVGIQYLEAVRILWTLKRVKFERTIHIVFMPDEEINCGNMGMNLFLKTPEFKAMNVGVAMDEGLANPENKYSAFHGERCAWWTRVKCKGDVGHGSRFIQNTASEKLRKVMNFVAEFRKSEEEKLAGDSCLFLGDVTTANLTMVNGGVQANVVPKEFIATFDFRIPPTVDLSKFEEKIAGWCKSAGKDVSYEFLSQNKSHDVTSTDSPWWRAFAGALEKRKVEIVKEVFPAGTDGRYLREKGYPVIGFSPMRNTPILLHDDDEFLNESVFVEGIEVYCEIIPAIANLKF